MTSTILLGTIGLLFVLLLACLLPLFTDQPEDQGDGRTYVRIPRYVRTPPHRPRTWCFVITGAVSGLLFLGWKHPSIPLAYADAVRGIAVAITRDPASVNGYVARMRPALALFAVTYIVALSLVVRAGLMRRLAMLGNALLYLAISVLAQALMIVIGVRTGWIVGPFGVEATLVNLLIGGLVVIRMTVTTFILPRATTVPLLRRSWLRENFLTCASLVSVVALLVGAYAFISQQGYLGSAWQIFLPIYAVGLLFVLMFVPLYVLFWLRPRLPTPGSSTEPVTIIIPAWNEEDNITRCLRSVDVAAGRYGGPVHVMVSNDGSEDATVILAEAEIVRFAHATGEILSAGNGGQAAAMNRGIQLATTDVLIRLDADCVLGPDTLGYGMPWFADPDVGTVGAIELPRKDTVTWFSRVRALEALFNFSFARVAENVVDGIVVIPGTLTFFRREPALSCGGFPVGMNGEDCDLTMMIGRLGYRVVVDPRMVSYEDVPRSPGEFIEQRTRWARAGYHTFTRHIPTLSGSAGPRIWYWTMRRGFSWFSLQAGLIAPIFLAELTLTSPTYRQNIVTFAVLYALGGQIPVLISLPFAVKHRQWRSILWAPTWFAFAFLRRVALLEAAISLPTRPFPAYRESKLVIHAPTENVHGQEQVRR
jgi:cellulose synthase/poly-beta-1,6-N-acetylglucosamine synthase-like glycosyltransferase